MRELTPLLDILQEPWVHTVLGLAVLLLAAWFSHRLGHRILQRTMGRLARHTAWQWDDAMVRHGVLRRVAQMIPVLILQYGIKLVPSIPQKIDLLVSNLALAAVIWFAALAINAALSALQDIFSHSEVTRVHSIKGYVQLGKIAIYIIAAIIIIAVLIGRSPLLLLSGLGAMSAVLLLVFKDTILSFVASIQLASNDLLRVGDWITMPQFNADGDVVDVALHTVKVQNFDMTITTIPTWRFISESFQNWRGMQQSGGRRIKRGLFIDITSTRFLDDEETQRLAKVRLLRSYLEQKHTDIEHWNARLNEHGKQDMVPMDQRRLTNIGTFRAYVYAYLKAHPDIHPDMTCMVRVLDPSPDGIPVEIYCFSSTTDWLTYERIQADIFDHLIAVLPEFGLRLYQRPAGSDLQNVLYRDPSTRSRP